MTQELSRVASNQAIFARASAPARAFTRILAILFAWCLVQVAEATPLPFPPLAALTFDPSDILTGEMSIMTISLSNANVSAIADLQFTTDAYPTGMANAWSNVVVDNTCGGTVTADPNGNSIALTGGHIDLQGSCSIDIAVVGTAAGSFDVSTGTIGSSNAPPGSPATGTLGVSGGQPLAAPIVSKAFAPQAVPPGGVSWMTITLTDPDISRAITGAQFTDNYPAGMINDASASAIVANTCGGTPTADANAHSAALVDATVPAGGSCSLVVRVVGSATGTNSTGPVTSNNAQAGASASALLTVAPGALLDAPTVTKSFAPDHVVAGDLVGTSVLAITLTNNDPYDITGVSFADNYPAPLRMANTPSGVVLVNTCGGTLTADANATSVTLAGGTIQANQSCVVKIKVMGTSAGSSQNHTGTVTSDNANVGADASATLTVSGSSAPDLTLTKNHAGNFSQGQTGATYTLIVGDAGGAPTAGTVTATDALPASLAATAMSGTGWTCNVASLSCVRSDSLAPGATYPAITLTVDVAAMAPPNVTNTATVDGGGETNTANDSASDPTVIDSAAPGPDLTLTKSHAGNFAQGQTGAAYALTVNNVGSAASAGVVTVSENLPGALTATAMSGPGWSCDIQTTTCTRSDSLAAGASFPAITLTVDVAINAPASVLNTATVGGGSETDAANDLASDLATVDGASLGADLTLTKMHAGNFSRGQTGAAYSLMAHNIGGAATSGTVTVADALPASLVATAMNGSGWTCNLQTTSCTRSDPLASGASYPAIALTVNVATNAPATVLNTATVGGGGEANTADDLASDPTAVDGMSAGPDLTLSKHHGGNFSQGQAGALYTLTAHNVGGAQTAGWITVADSLPAELTATSMSGPGWTCTLATTTCTRLDTLAAGASYPAIQLVVDVAANAPPSVINTAAISGGGETNANNDSAADPTTVDSIGGGTAQSIVFTSTAPGNAIVGDPAYQAAATATSGLPVVLTIDGASATVCTINAGAVDFIGAGTCTIDANQGGGMNNGTSYAPASQVQQSFSVTSSGGTTTQTIVFTSAAPGNAMVGGPTYAAAATASSGLPVVLTIDGTSATVCTINAGAVDFIGAGICTIDANQGGGMHNGTNYAPAPQAQQSFAVASAGGQNPQAIMFTSVTPVDATVAGPSYLATATASSGLPVALTIDGASATVCAINSGIVAFIGAGTCTIDANQGGDASFAAASEVQQSFAVTSAGGVADQTITFTSTAPVDATVGGPTYLATAIASSGLPVVLTIDGASATVCAIDNGTVTFIGAGTCTIDANQGGDATFALAPEAQQSFVVASAGGATAQTIAFTSTAPVDATVAGPTYFATATASSGLPVVLTIEAMSATVCAINDGIVAFVGAGMCEIDANQGGDTTYAPAPQEQQVFAVASEGGASAQTITFTSMAPADAAVAGPTYLATATASSGLPVVVTIDGSAATVCTINNGTVSFIGPGVCTIDANQGGDGTFAPAPELQQSFNVSDGSGAPSVTCMLQQQINVVGDTVNLDLSLLFTPPANETLSYSATNLPPSLSIVGSLLSGTLQASDVPPSPPYAYASTLTATTVPSGVSASEDVTFQVLPTGEILLRNGFDSSASTPPCL